MKTSTLIRTAASVFFLVSSLSSFSFSWGAATTPSLSPEEIATIKELSRASVPRFENLLSEPRNNDRAEDLVDEFKLLSLQEMENARATSAHLDETPWSDDYWPLYAGILAKRYADANFPDSYDWKENSDFILKTLGQEDPAPSSSVEKLSPAEKYDLLVGDKDNTLTKAMLEEGKLYHERHGKVESWMGICHGWAPASYMLPRPEQAVTLLAADGHTQILFYPSDIKGLASLLWAKAYYPTRYIAGRCNVKKPKRDSNGRIVDPDCIDSNAGTWHLSVVNQIAVSKRSFVIDATYSMEVWNQPVYAFYYSYFNPKSGTPVRTLAEAAVSTEEFENDPYRNYRSRNAVSIVGINMKVSYVVETSPTTDLKDSPANDQIHSAIYEYDLELDSQGKIVGGEWRNPSHPDFMWTPAPGARAQASGDLFVDAAAARSSSMPASWDPRGVVPAAWLSAIQSSSAAGQPLAKIVEPLILMSRLTP